MQNAEHAPRSSLRSSRPPSLGVPLALRLHVGVLRLGTPKQAVSCTRAHKSEPRRQNHREGAPQQTKCCLGGSDERSEERGACSAFCITCNEASPSEPKTSKRSVSLPPISSVAPKWGAANAPSSHRYGANPDLLLGASRWQAPFAGGRPSAKREKVRSARRREPHRMIRLRWRVQGLPVYVRCVQNQRKELSNATRIFEYKVPCQGWSKAARQERPLTQP
jgi:hypothetical protein